MSPHFTSSTEHSCEEKSAVLVPLLCSASFCKLVAVAVIVSMCQVEICNLFALQGVRARMGVFCVCGRPCIFASCLCHALLCVALCSCSLVFYVYVASVVLRFCINCASIVHRLSLIVLTFLFASMRDWHARVASHVLAISIVMFHRCIMYL